MEEIKELELSEIVLKEQPRKSFEEIDELASSIMKQGLMTPILVKKEGTKYILLDGERRYRAYKNLSKHDDEYKKIKAVIVKPKDWLITQLAIDVHKNKLNHLDEGESYKKLIEEKKLSIEEISMMIGKNANYIRDKLKLTAFNDTTKQLIREGKVPAQLLYSLDINKIKNAENRIISRIKSEKPSRGEIRRIIIEEVEKDGRLIDKFCIDLEKFIYLIDNFNEKSKNIVPPDINKLLGTINTAKINIKEFYNHANKLLKIKEDSWEILCRLEKLEAKYGKGADISKCVKDGFSVKEKKI